MSKKLSVGDKVECKFYNTPDKHFYGDIWKGEIIEITEHGYLVKKLTNVFTSYYLHRKEILRRVKD